MDVDAEGESMRVAVDIGRCGFFGGGVGFESLLFAREEVATRVASCVFSGLERGVRLIGGRSDRFLLTNNSFIENSVAAIDLEDTVALDGHSVSLRTKSGRRAFRRPSVWISNNLFLLSVVDHDAPEPAGGVLLPSSLVPRTASRESVTNQSSQPVVIARNLFYPDDPEYLRGRVFRVFWRAPGATSWEDRYLLDGWDQTGAVWRNITGPAPGLVRDAGPELDVHPAVSAASPLIGDSLPLRPPVGVAGGTSVPLEDLPEALGFPGYPETGYYDNERPAVPQVGPGGGPAVGAAEPVGWREFPILLYGVGVDNLGSGSSVTPLCDLVTKGVGLEVTAPTPGNTPAQDAEHFWLIQDFVLPYCRGAAEAGVKALVPIAFNRNSSAPVSLVSGSGLTAGEVFTIPYDDGSGQPASYQITPAFTDWAMERITIVLQGIAADPLARSGVAGYWSLPEEPRANLGGLYRDYNHSQRMRRLVEEQHPGALLTTYFPNSLAATGAFSTLFSSVGWRAPLLGLDAVELGPLPASQSDFVGFAQALLGQLGLGDEHGLRWRLYDGRGIAAELPPAFDPDNSASWPRDQDGFVVPQFDPDYFDFPDRVAASDARVGNLEQSPGGGATGKAFADVTPPWPEWGDVDVYRPWEPTSSYVTSLYTMPDALGFHAPVFDHLLVGSYLDRLLGAQQAPAPDVNRILGLHLAKCRMDMMRGVRQTVRTWFRQDVGHNRVFHAPELVTGGGTANPDTPAHARHDFWIGLHDCEGFMLYRYEPGSGARWAAYEESLALLKGTAREFLVAGERVEDLGFGYLSVGDPAEDPGLDLGDAYYGPTLGAVPDYPSINVSGFRIRDRVLVIITSSYEQVSEIELGQSGLLSSATAVQELLTGTGLTPGGTAAGPWSYTVDGIDGTVLLFEL